MGVSSFSKLLKPRWWLLAIVVVGFGAAAWFARMPEQALQNRSSAAPPKIAHMVAPQQNASAPSSVMAPHAPEAIEPLPQAALRAPDLPQAAAPPPAAEAAAPPLRKDGTERLAQELVKPLKSKPQTRPLDPNLPRDGAALSGKVKSTITANKGPTAPSHRDDTAPPAKSNEIFPALSKGARDGAEHFVDLPQPKMATPPKTAAPPPKSNEIPDAFSKAVKIGTDNSVGLLPSIAAAAPLPAATHSQEEKDCLEKLRKRGIVLQSGPCVDIAEIVASLDTGTYVFKKPDLGWVGESFRFVLILQTAKGQEKEVASALESAPGVKVERQAKFAQNLEATLSGPDLKVDPAGPVARTATAAEPVEWDWTVTPQAEGKKPLSIEVAANVVVGATPTHVQLKVLHEAIEIKIGIIQRFKAGLTELNALTASLLALLTTLAGIFGFVRPARRWFVGLFHRGE